MGTYGRLTLLNHYEKRGNKKYILCKCECGTEKLIREDHLKSGKIKSCGCYNNALTKRLGESKSARLTGQKFGRLTVLKRVGSNRNKQAIWLCDCDCGNQITARTSALTSGNTASCGCYRNEQVSIRQREHNNMAGLTRDKSPNWNPELSDEERELNKCRTNTVEYIQFRRQVFKTKGRICDCCNQTAKEMVVHHLDGWDEHFDVRFDIDNAVVLCENCHKSFHATYGYGKNTAEQYIQFKLHANTEITE